MTEISKKARERLMKDGKFLITKVNFETIEELAAWIVESRPERKEFTVVISSPGGSPAAAHSFASFVRTLGKDVKLTGVAFSECGSAALALLQCLHVRIAVEQCGFFIHRLHAEMDASPHSTSTRQYKEEVENSRRLEREMVRLQCARSGMSVAAWNKLADLGQRVKSRPLFPAEALKLGLVDKVVQEYPLF
jgi:ATP-dependent protease ClpP protease subunit